MSTISDVIAKIIGILIVGVFLYFSAQPLYFKYKEHIDKKELALRQQAIPMPTEAEQKRIQIENENAARRREELKNKAEKKIKDLGYVIVQSGQNEYYAGSAKISYAVKVLKLKFNYLTSEYEEITGDKVYQISLHFRMFNEFEIVGIDLFDFGNNTKRQLE